MAVRYKDYYAILGVPRNASEDEIKKAFRRLARQHHPDVAKDKRAAEERFKEINEAYEVLGTPENRRRYDQLGADWRPGAEFRPPPGWQQRSTRRRTTGEAQDFEFRFGGTGFSDFFESLFGGAAGAGPAGAGGFRGFGFEPEAADLRAPGADIEGDIMVALDEVLHGSVRTISLQRTNPRDGTSERSSFQVRIPPGIREGQSIRVPGKGQPGAHDQAGDLYLRVRLARHPDFRVRDRDLYADVTVAPWEPVLGGTIRVATLEGDVHLRVPPGSRGGQQLRLRGRGLPTGDGARGDLYVTLVIDVPASVEPEERALWEQLAAQSRYRPRRED